MDDGLIEMVVEGVRVHMLSSRHVVILKETGRERYLPIWIGPWEASAIAMRLQGLTPERPLTHDLFASTLEAVEAKADAYRADGWSEVIVLEPGQYFHSWEYERRSKAKGGKVFISVGHRGDVTFHEGYVTLKEARRQERGEAVEEPSRPELSAPLGNYIDLHRHAAVRAAVASKPDIALRLMLAHAIHGSLLFRITPEPQRALTDAIAESVTHAHCLAQRLLHVVGADRDGHRLSGTLFFVQLQRDFDRVAGEVVEIEFETGLIDAGSGSTNLEA